MQARTGDAVTVHYVGRLNDGTLFDTSQDDDPLDLVIGDGDLLPAFEKAIIGMTVGEHRAVTIPAARAYGKHRAELVRTVERTLAPKNIPLETGMQMGSTGPDGEEVVITILEVDKERITIDANHPLAGHDLEFEIELVAVKPKKKSRRKARTAA